jgi:hypothetical protein
MSNISASPKSTFRLLTPANDYNAPSDAPFVFLCGRRWVLRQYPETLEKTDIPSYICISYSWGEGRTKNIFEDGQEMSDRTIPVIESALKASRSSAIWVDALCVPSESPDREACLLRMGEIYSAAEAVYVILSKACSEVFRQIRNANQLNAEALIALESDDWVERPWTYQESANRSINFIAEGDDGRVAVSDIDLLNVVQDSVDGYIAARKTNIYNFALQFPRVDYLQNLIASHNIEFDLGLSAYQVLSDMYRRYSDKTMGFFSALICAFSPVPVPLNSQTEALSHSAEYFMQVCEAKDDYSFIYCVAPRSEVPGRRWRPVADHIPPLTTHLIIHGSGQTGSLEPTHLQLNNMSRMTPGVLNGESKKAVNFFVSGSTADLQSGDLVNLTLNRLRQLGFSGCGDYLELENGYFFPQSPFVRSEEHFVAISPDVIWTNGGPSLLLLSNGTDINCFCDVGVFVGSVSMAGGEVINVG